MRGYYKIMENYYSIIAGHYNIIGESYIIINFKILSMTEIILATPGFELTTLAPTSSTQK